MNMPGFATLDMPMRFRYVCGAVTPIADCHDTGWRTLPFSLCAQNMAHPCDIEFGDGRKTSTSHGAALVVPSGVQHRIRLRPGGRSVSRWAHFELTLFDTVDALSLCCLPKVFKGDEAKEMGDLCEMMAKTASCPSLEGMAKMNSLGFQLAALVFKCARPLGRFSETCESYRRISPALKLIGSLHGRSVSLEEMAESCDLSPSRFSALFRTATGKSPVRYQARARLARARSLLVRGGSRVGEVAVELGYKDQFHFSKAFKQDSGMSPKAYREKARTELRKASF